MTGQKARRFLSIGECMIELAQAGDNLLRKGFAGDTFNTAWYVHATASADWQTAYFTALGDDPASDEMQAFIDAAGIDTSDIARIAGRTPGLYMIHLKDGERSFSYWRDRSAARLLADDADRLRGVVNAADVVYFSGITLAILPPAGRDTFLSEIRRARAGGKIVAFDPNIRPRLWPDGDTLRSVISDGARASTLVMPSFDDETTHFGDTDVSATIARYRALGVRDILVKNGAHGATLAFETQDAVVPAAVTKDVVDTTGAGDSFNGAFLGHYLTSGEPLAAAGFAAGIAARVIGQHGALVRL